MRVFIPPKVGTVVRKRPKANRDPDSLEWEEYEFVHVGNGLYKRELVMEEYDVDVIRLPCGCSVPNDETNVLGSDVFGATYDVECPRCKKVSKISDETAISIARWANSYSRKKSGWVDI